MNKYTFINKRQKSKLGEIGDSLSIYDINDHQKNGFFFDIEELSIVHSFYPDIINETFSNNFYRIVWFFKGTGTCNIDFNEYDIEPNTIFFLSPEQIFQYVGLYNYEGLAISFSKDFLFNLSENMQNLIKHKIFSLRGSASICKLDLKASKNLLKECSRIKCFIDNYRNSGYYNDYISMLFSLFLLNILSSGSWCKDIKSVQYIREWQIYFQFVEFLEHNFKTIHIAEKYVKLIGNISLSSLTKILVNLTGKTPSRIINERIILEAKKMLHTDADIRVKEIAAELKFEDSSNFIKFFKRHVGISPIKFRESAHGYGLHKSSK